jgi:hypothetical protein
MSDIERGWARVEQLDAERVVRALRERAGIELVVEGLCPGGQVGAAYVRWPDGHRSVLTWRPGTHLSQVRAGPIAVAEALRAIGYPAPATEIAVQIDRDVVLVQELLPGMKIDCFDSHALEQAHALNELQAGALADLRDEMEPVALYLRDDGPGFCLHEPLRRHNSRSAAVERRIQAVADEYPDYLPGDDAMHVDFHPGNMLVSDGVITGVVDWDGAGRGDRRLDLVTLRFGVHGVHGVHGEPAEPGVVERLDAILDALPESVLRPAWAHMSLRMTDWAIRHFTADAVEHWLDLAEQRAW